MTHPMQPTPEQCAVWWGEAYNATRNDNWEATGHYLARLAYAAGADAELEACIALVDEAHGTGLNLRVTRRPGPETLRRDALDACATALAAGRLTPDEAGLIRCALEGQP